MNETVASGGRSAGGRRRRLTRPREVLAALGRGVAAGVLALAILVGILAILIPALIGGRSLAVLTSSMEPTYPAGSMVVVAPTPPADVRIGDVLTFQLESGKATLVTHRVVEISTRMDGSRLFTTRGDANDIVDADPVQEVQVVGTVAYMIPWLGWVSTAVNGDMRAYIVPAVVGALLVYAVWMAISAARDKVRTKDAASAS